MKTEQCVRVCVKPWSFFMHRAGICLKCEPSWPHPAPCGDLKPGARPLASWRSGIHPYPFHQPSVGASGQFNEHAGLLGG